MVGHDIIVVGASAGGVEALKSLVSQLPSDLEAAVFVVLHVPAEPSSNFSWILDRAGPLPAKEATDGEPIQPRTIYVARPDYHLLVKQGYAGVVQGPKENRHRPAIDPLFRSAAVAYTSRVIGVLLSGMLDDGTAGLLAIKKCGGFAVVQDPQDAMYPEMPQNAISNIDVDYVLPLVKIAPLLSQLSIEPAKPPPPVPPEVMPEVRASDMMRDMSDPAGPGTAVPVTCPDCGGPLMELVSEKILRYRCIVGHSFSGLSLDQGQKEGLEKSLWMALRTLEERVIFLKKMARNERDRGREGSGKSYDEEAETAMQHARTLRAWMMDEKEPLWP